MAIQKIAFQKCFEDRKKRWHKCAIAEGDYFEGKQIFTFCHSSYLKVSRNKDFAFLAKET